MPTCFDVIVRYPLPADVRERDAQIMAAVKRAVPRLPRYVDTAAGPFCPRGARGERRCRPQREVQIDNVSLCARRAAPLTSEEARRLAAALHPLGVRVAARRGKCACAT